MLRIFTFAYTLLSIPVFSQKLPSFNRGNNITTLSGDTIFTFHTLGITSGFSPSEKKIYHWFDQGKIGFAQGGVTGKLLHGPYEAKKKGRGLVAKGKFKRGLKSGIWLQWHPTGRIKSKVSWVNGSRRGAFYEYSQSGDLLLKAKYVDDKLHGEWKSYQYGKLIQKKKFRRGVEVLKPVEKENVRPAKPARQQKSRDSLNMMSRHLNKPKRKRSKGGDSLEIVTKQSNSVASKGIEPLSGVELEISNAKTSSKEDGMKGRSKISLRRKKRRSDE